MTSDENNSNYNDDLNTFIIASIVLFVMFSIGLYLQIKIIIVSKQGKQNQSVAWKIDICHSIVMIVYFSFRILFEGITYITPPLHLYTGNWFCYFTVWVDLFGLMAMGSYSLVIAIYKYVYIVHRNLIDSVDKANLISIWGYLIFSALLAVTFIARPNVMASKKQQFACFGKEVAKLERSKSAGDRIQRFFFCDFDDNDDTQYGVFGYFINIANTMGCFLTAIVLLVMMLNLLECFLYQRMFALLKR